MDKLKELTDKLYNEGLSRGKEEGEALLAKAKAEAERVVGEAKRQAEEIVKAAKKDAEDYTAKIKSDLKMASAQTIQATKKDVENLIVAKETDLRVDAALSSPDYVKEIITAVARNFSADKPSDLALVLPEAQKAELETFVKGELSEILGAETSASFSKKIAGGFQIGPKDGSYFISLTDETFKTLIAEYLRPATKKLLFG